jgi:maltooligosyltrehalose trehalohydrolase
MTKNHMNKTATQIHTGHLVRRHGPEVTNAGVDYRLWSPDAKFVSVLIGDGDSGNSRRVELSSQPGGWFTGLDEAGKAGDLYEFILDYQTTLPDVASRFQPQGIKGRSQVIAANVLSAATNQRVKINADELVIYELHIGTFSETGTFAGAIQHLRHLEQLGVNAVQLMPVAAFPGNRNWGYDVTLPFAPANAYGTPDGLRRLIAAAHRHHLAVIIDVVYNHVCGEPNYLLGTSRHYFKSEGGNAWGSSLNFDGEHADGVRAFFKQNAV